MRLALGLIIGFLSLNSLALNNEDDIVAWHDQKGQLYSINNEILGVARYEGYIEIFGEKERNELKNINKFFVQKNGNVFVTLNGERKIIGKLINNNFNH